MQARRVWICVILPFGCLVLGGCSAEPSTATPSATVDQVVPPTGVADPAWDPAVVAVERDGALACAGALVLPDVVFGVRHCFAPTASCPGQAYATLAPASGLVVAVVQEGGPVAAPTPARALLLPDDEAGCAADVAALVLTRSLTGVLPLSLRPTPIALGDHVRSIDFAPRGGGLGKRVRDHLTVVLAQEAAFGLAERACDPGCGGVIVDEATAELSGLVVWSNDANACGSKGSCVGVPNALDSSGARFNVAAGRPALATLLARARAASAAPTLPRTAAFRTRKGPVDMGAYCRTGDDCAAGVCVTSGSQRYCSRACAPLDRCVSNFHCVGMGGIGRSGVEDESGACVQR